MAETVKANDYRIGMGTQLLINEAALGGVTTIGEIQETSDEVEVTNLGSGGVREYIPGISDSGTMTVDGYVDKDNFKKLKEYKDGKELVKVAIYNKDLEVINAEFDAIVKTVTRGAIEAEGVISYTVEFRISGAIRDYNGPVGE